MIEEKQERGRRGAVDTPMTVKEPTRFVPVRFFVNLCTCKTKQKQTTTFSFFLLLQN